MTGTHEKKIEGTVYRADIRTHEGKVYASISVRRDFPDGSFKWAALSLRQHKAQARALRAFGPEIEAARMIAA
jgi:hypothetical protein